MKTFFICMFAALVWCSGFAGDGEVLNGMVPKGKAKVLSFKEELHIGADTHDDWLLVGSKADIAVNDQGAMYVMDPKNYQIHLYAADGTHLKSVGSDGEGPGEFRFMTNLSLLKDGTVMVFEFRQGSHVFTTFDKDLNFLEQKKSAAFDGRMLVAAAFSPKADLFTGYWMAMGTGGNAFVRNGVWTTDYEVKEQFFEAELFMFNPNEANKPSWWASYMAQWFALGPKQAVIVHDNKGRVYVADSQKYEVTRYNQKMEKELSFKKEYKPLPLSEAYASKMVESVREEVLAALPGPFHKFITDATVGKALELADFNPVKQPIFGMLPMEDHVLVFHDYDIDRGILTADIFDGQGAYLGTTKLPKVAYNYFGAYFASYVKMCFRDGKAYALVPDSDGELSLKRYAYELK